MNPFLQHVLRTRLQPRGAALALAILAASTVLAPSGAEGQQVDSTYYAGMRWRLIGPYRAGNVYAVAGVPGDPTVYYIGTPEGGVWRTTDGGTVWRPVFDAEHVASIGAVGVAASAPNVVYVGTGDPTGWSFTPGNGVYRSDDSGATWRSVGLEETKYITALVVDPHDPDVVLVGALGARQFGGGANTARGIYRSADGGRTWNHVLYLDAYTGVTGMSADASDSRIVYATLARGAFGLAAAQRDSLAPLGTGIYKTSDGGITWTPVSGQGLPSAARGFAAAVASGTDGRRVYAEAQGAGRDAGGLYRSDDGGASWELATRQLLSAGGPIYVDPGNPDVVYLMGTAMYRSMDGGRHIEAYKGSAGGDDPRELWIDPRNPRRMLLGVDQGPTITVDGGATWTPWYNLPNGQFYRVSTDNHFPYRVCAPQQDSGTACVLSRSDFGAIRDNDWVSAGGFEDGFITVDPENDRWVYTQGWYHVLRRFDRATGQVAVLYTPTPSDHFNGAPPLVFSPQNPHVLYMGAQYVLVSRDSARTWRHMSPDLTRARGAETAQVSPFGRRLEPTIQALAPSAVAPGEIWVGTSNGLIQLTRNGGTSWTNVTPMGLPARAAVNVIDASHHLAGTAYATVMAFGDDRPHIYRTSDFGRTWQEIVTGLPQDALARTVREDPVDPDLLYAGTVTGAWVSFDRGDHWQSLQLNLPTTVVSDMQSHGSDLVISTYGRALWILDDVTPLRQVQAALARRSAPYLYQPERAYRMRWDNIQDTPLPPEVPAGENPPEGAIIDYRLPAPASSVTLSVYDAASHLVRQYSSVAQPPDSSPPNIPTYWFAPPVVLPTTAGMHRIAWDLREPPPAALNYGYYGGLLDYTEYTLNTHSIKGATPRREPVGPLVAPGTYRVELSVDGQHAAQPLEVINDPRVPIARAALLAQTRLQDRMVHGMAVSFEGYNAVAALQAALATVEGSDQLRSAARSLDEQAAALASGASGQGGFGPGNRDLARHLDDMEFGDVAPTPSDVAAVDAACHEVDAALTGLRRLEGKDVPALNAMLAAAQRPALPVAKVAAGPACGPEGTGR
jgi:photosystem II stability/assembly factor-like uncharacterized protein